MDNEKKTKLELIGEEARLAHRLRNTFTGISEQDVYSRTHTMAMSDEETPVHGKGTGKYLDTSAGGGSVDINGDPAYGKSGRKGSILQNIYSKDKPYQKPGMSGNLGEE